MNTGTAEKVVELRRKYPTIKAIEIARQVNISRERVRQILAQRGLPTAVALPSELCGLCGRLLHEKNKGGICQQCLRKVRVTYICFQCGREYQSTLLESKRTKYCPDCREAVRRRRVRFSLYRRKWEQQKKSRKYRCIFCQSVFDSVVELSTHRVESEELSDPDFRKWVMAYRSTHSYWQTLDYFHISQETFRAILKGKETTKHH